MEMYFIILGFCNDFFFVKELDQLQRPTAKKSEIGFELKVQFYGRLRLSHAFFGRFVSWIRNLHIIE